MSGGYVAIQAFMVDDLKLSGNELIVFAAVHGFSQDRVSWFCGSRAYLARWCGSSVKTVSRALANLCERGLLERREKVVNGVTLVDYRVNPECLGAGQNVPAPGTKRPGGGDKMATPPGTKRPTISYKENLEENLTESEGAQRKRFTPPTPDEVAAYAKEKGLAIDPHRFCDYYAAQGWKLSNGNSMCDWKAAARKWARHDAQASTPKGVASSEYALDF